MMTVFKAYWRKLRLTLLQETPGLTGCDEADRAVRRSERAVDDARRVHGEVVGNTDYLVEVKRRNHILPNITDALTARRAT